MHAERCPVCGGSGNIPFYNGVGLDARPCHGCNRNGWVVVADAGDPARMKAAELAFERVRAEMGKESPAPNIAVAKDAGTDKPIVMSRALVDRLFREGRLEYEQINGQYVVTGVGWGTLFIGTKKESP